MKKKKELSPEEAAKNAMFDAAVYVGLPEGPKSTLLKHSEKSLMEIHFRLKEELGIPAHKAVESMPPHIQNEFNKRLAEERKLLEKKLEKRPLKKLDLK